MISAALLFLTPQRIPYVVGAAVLAVFIWYGAHFVQQKYAAEQAIVVLSQQLKERDFTIKTLNMQAAQKEEAQRVADTARTVLENYSYGYDKIRTGIATSTQVSDGPVAPVLRNALDALGGM
jgi:hypothetical protein